MKTYHSLPGIDLDQYRNRIRLDEHYEHGNGIISSEKGRDEILDFLLNTLIVQERLALIDSPPADLENKRQLLRALLNIRPPGQMKKDFIENINKLLADELNKKEILDCNKIAPVSEVFLENHLKHPDRLFLWKGDITSLKIDAIVNAANDKMLGCFQPLHNCIDNVIHSAAGPLLREDCKKIMDIQGVREKTGDAKITRAYNLPSKYVLHTVGPVITGKEVSEYQQEQLASCYTSCLSVAAQVKEIKSIAFPCISTGVFNFPRKLAAEIAVRTVDEWLETSSHAFSHVVFNVFLEEDFSIYARIFRGGNN
jgi:O-acetyl-ADP-ribose deacetylase (regulator of RNase III)